MTARHTLREYIDVLNAASLLTESTVDDALACSVIDCFSYDNRALCGTALFLCKGAHFKEAYLHDALAHGAIAYVADHAYDADAPRLIVSDIRAALAALGRLYYNSITDKLITVGITGTKGKSTTAYYMRYILNDYLAGEGKPNCALLSSIDTYDGVADEPSHITTPEVLELYQHFQNAYDHGISHLVMEASSQALKYGRVRGMTFDVAAFLNIGEDHISPVEHPDFEDYFASKLKIFDQCRVGCVSTDAEHADRVLACAKERCKTITFGSHQSDDVYCEKVEKRGDGIYFTVHSAKYNGEFSLTMPGLFNVQNALAAIAMSMALDIPEDSVRRGLRAARVSGRMEIYRSRDGEVTVIVDYAHNALSFHALFHSAQLEFPGCRLIAVFGSVGGKAQSRRKDLGVTASRYADYVYLTEDEPGEESAADIAAQIEAYVTCPHEIDLDRGDCIRKAILEQSGRRIVLCTGKGHENTMKRGTSYVPVPTDAEWAEKYLREYDERSGR